MSRRSSVTLTPVWSGEGGGGKPILDIDVPDDTAEGSGGNDNGKGAAPPVAFFPLPKLEDGQLMRSPSARRVLMDAPASPPRHPVNEDTNLGQISPKRRSVTFGSFRKSKQEAGSTKPNEEEEEDSDDVSDWSGSSINSDDLVDLANVFWEDVPEAPADAILGIASAYRACEHPNKVNVCVGAYRDENGKPWVLPSVREAEKILLEENDIKEYLPIEGDREFVELAMKFAYGADMPMDHLAGVQTLSGTGACRIGGTFLAQFWPQHPIYVPSPTWGNHVAIFREAGLDVRKYRYYNRATNSLDFKGMIKDIKKAPEGSIILLHACAHNPTGCDPTIEQWKHIVHHISNKKHVAFFDSAYQGFASGNAEEDAQPFRYAVSKHVPIVLAQSFAKNFGLYGERCGTLSVVCGDMEQKEHILSELRTIIRPMYSSPPRHGSSIVKTVLKHKVLNPQYYKECAYMSQRIQSMRKRLVEVLNEVGSKHDWSHVTKQIGMFAFTGLTTEMCFQLTNEYAIYLTTNGRISIAGLNPGNIEYVAKAIHAVTDGKSITAE